MKRVAITGANGFIGLHLRDALRLRKDVEVFPIIRSTTYPELLDKIATCDIVFHLAGVNRPHHEYLYRENHDCAVQVVQALTESKRRIPIVYASSMQADVENPYGISKRQAEQVLRDYERISGARCSIYRLKNVFGARGKPNYNSVVSTFCYNITRGLPIQIHDPSRVLELVWVGDVVSAFLQHLDSEFGVAESQIPEYQINLQKLADLLQEFAKVREGGELPDLNDRFTRLMHSTFTSYWDPNNLAYDVNRKDDSRGWLFELVRSRHAGQIFVSKTKPGIDRGNHWHMAKIEKFCVVQGKALIKFRNILSAETQSYEVDDESIKILDIPPGYTHKIVNIGENELITIFWANEPFDPKRPDTFFEAVDQ